MKIQDRVEQVRQYVAASGEGDKEAITMLLSACSDKGSSDGCLLSVKAFDNAADHILLYLKHTSRKEKDMEARYQLTNEEIAEVAHEVNKAYCKALGDESQVGWSDAPQWQKNSAMLGVQLHLDQPEAGPEASHKSWLDQKIKDGWKYGKDKDPDKKEHPCLVPFSQLPKDQQAKDFIFRGVVMALAGLA